MISSIHDPFGILTDINYYELLEDFRSMQFETEIPPSVSNFCTQCGSILHRSINNITNTCSTCGCTTDEISEEAIDVNDIMNNKIRIVGYNSNQFQPNLYRSDNGNICMLQKKQILGEYKEYRQKFIELGERAFPLNACELATELYNKIQQHCVKRSQNKKAIMAACLWQACLTIDFAPSKIEIARFMQLPHKGIARGNNFIRSLVSEGQLDIDPNIDTIYPEIRTLFLQMSYIGDQYKKLHDIIHDLIQLSIEKSIGINSLSRSKVIGSTYIVLRRSKHWDIITNVPNSTKDFCRNKIRKNTIDRFITEINAYHSYFKEYYTSVNLIDTMPLP
jgi:predicted  nucleic acid-binding Zn-ribbon protein